MAAAGAGPGHYTIGKLEVEVGTDQIVRQPGKTNFAGSALRPIDGVFRAAQMLNCPWQEAWSRFSLSPLRLMGLSRELTVGARATFCAVRVDHESKLCDLQTYWNG
jgi:N-acetylglucosamine-6-phosphate deacetylase